MTRAAFGPPRPCAIATVVMSGTDECSLSSLQTLLYSIHLHVIKNPSRLSSREPETEKAGYLQTYPPEVIVVAPSSMPVPAFVKFLCTRVIQIAMNVDTSEKATERATLVTNLFCQTIYQRILFIDQHCLVQKDISHILRVGDEEAGLITAIPCSCLCNDNEESQIMKMPLLFDSSVMLIKPSIEIYNDLEKMILCNSKSNEDDNPDGEEEAEGKETCINEPMQQLSLLDSIMNEYFQISWTTLHDEHKLLGMEYNYNLNLSDIFRTKSNFNVNNTDIYIWNNYTYNHCNNRTKYDQNPIHQSKLIYYQHLFQKIYKKSNLYIENQKEEEQLKLQATKDVQHKKKQTQQLLQQQQQSSSYQATSDKTKVMQKHHLVSKRYKQLRKEGKDPKLAMTLARQEYGMDKDDKMAQSPSQQVASMFGMV